jgi:hypothetical protein
MQNLQQHHRIRAAGNGHEDFLPPQKQATFLDFAFNTLKELAHSASLPVFSAPGKQGAMR